MVEWKTPVQNLIGLKKMYGKLFKCTWVENYCRISTGQIDWCSTSYCICQVLKLVLKINGTSKIDSKEPFNLTEDQEMTYFNNPRKFEKHLQYNLYFSFTRPYPIWDQRKLKENRSFLPDIRENAFQQEAKKAVPALISMNYGKRKCYDSIETKYNKIDQISSFYRRNGCLPVCEKMVSSNMHSGASAS